MPDFARKCLECDYPLDRLDSNKCPECGRAFDRNDPRTFRTDTPGAVVEQTSLDDPVRLMEGPVSDVVAAQLALENACIDNAMYDETGGVIAVVQFPAASLWVNSSDEQNAKQILDKMSNDADAELLPPWTCPNCGETVEGQFDECWNCGTMRDGATV